MSKDHQTLAHTEIAILAAGCFWGVQQYFDQVPGVVETTVGYTGGVVADPTYEQVCTHTTGHAEAVRVVFDPDKVSYAVLLRHFFRLHDPTQVNRQGPDIGDSYRSAIFYASEEQKIVAERIRAEVQNDYSLPVATEITRAGMFYPAEEYHQKYAEKTGRGMCHVTYAPVA